METLYDPPWGGGGNTGLQDLDVTITVGWSPSNNMLYHAVKVFDDEHFADPTKAYYDNDEVHMYTNPSHDGLQYQWPGPLETGNQWWFGVDPPSTDWGEFGYMNNEKGYLDPAYTVHAWSKSADGKTYYYEWAVALWDFQANTESGGLAAARRHTLGEGETIGHVVGVYDIDTGQTPSEASTTPRTGEKEIKKAKKTTKNLLP